MTDTFLDELNPSQREAVEYLDGPLLVIAGAGSGKTRVLTYKTAWLLAKGYMPWNILALTFTNKAAREMKERIAKLTGEDVARSLNMGTFHSVFSRILRREAAHIGYRQNFTIYDDSDSRSLIKAIIKERGLDDKAYKPATIQSRIGMAKNKLIMPSDYRHMPGLMERDLSTKTPATADIYEEYCRRCRMANAMDFDDLLTNTYALFSENDDIRSHYAERFRYILVDEYQDTNAVQQHIITQLAAEHGGICAVGDDAQSIYAFRGADIDNILDFQNQFKGTRLLKLERNYRSTQRIVKAANSLIIHNKRQIRKDVYSRNAEGGRVLLKPAYSDREEAVIVCNEIKKLRRKENLSYGEVAVLYRTNSQSRSFEEAMRRVSIPYRIYGGLGFYQRKEIKDIISYFRVVVNPDDEEGMKRIINYPKRGLGDVVTGRIKVRADVEGVSMWHVIMSPEAYGIEAGKVTMTRLAQFREMMKDFIRDAAESDAYVMAVEIIERSKISTEINSDNSDEGRARQENLDELLSSIQDFVESRKEEGRGDAVSLSDFLQEVSLLTDTESEDGGEDGGKVSLMTLHSAKGLEFPAVFIVGLEENIFPSPRSTESLRGIEEERRLLYVGITRAEKYCILTYALNRYRYGHMENGMPSRFLSEIDPELLDKDIPSDVFSRASETSPYSSTMFAKHRPTYIAAGTGMSVPASFSHTASPAVERSKSTVSSNSSATARLSMTAACSRTSRNGTGTIVSEGCIIEHERFGEGRIIRLEGTGENTKATVEFRNTGVKQLLLKFARFKVIG